MITAYGVITTATVVLGAGIAFGGGFSLGARQGPDVVTKDKIVRVEKDLAPLKVGDISEFRRRLVKEPKVSKVSPDGTFACDYWTIGTKLDVPGYPPGSFIAVICYGKDKKPASKESGL